jgi:hypothetical protein
MLKKFCFHGFWTAEKCLLELSAGNNSAIAKTVSKCHKLAVFPPVANWKYL